MPSPTPAPHRRDLRRWQVRRRRHRTAVRRRVGVLAAALTLVVAGAGAQALAPDRVAKGYAQVSAWVPGDSEGRDAATSSRSSDRTPAPASTGEPTATSSAPAESAAGAGVPAVSAAPDATATPSGTSSPQATQPAAGPADAAPPTSPDGGGSPAGDPAASAPQAAAAPAPAVEASLTQQIVDLTNVERAAAGLPALAVSACGAAQAQARTDLLVAEDRFEHDPLGPIMRACAASTVGENLAMGYRDASSTVAGWMASQGHRENILRRGYTSIGVACTAGPNGQLCAQVFLG
ncbi:CAP domain-containing protein [Cellulomonas soli]|uniref:CAP domain-containing protein n=1 Tax=Cellulomonas soli TaxID=931535 RepID=UPI003F872B2D